MAITDITAFAHLTDADVDMLCAELDALRTEVEQSRGAADSRYLHRVIRFHRSLELGGRVAVFASRKRLGTAVGIGLLAAAKVIENVELGHNISHGQWDWMNDPEIHSTAWEWDMAGSSAQWQRAHNYSHHVFTNIIGLDDDVGFGILRVTRDEPWRPIHLAQPVVNVLIALTFEWGIASRGLSDAIEVDGSKRWNLRSAPNREFARKAARQIGKDYVLFPALSGRSWLRTLKANLAANVLRNVWTYIVIFCGHFPDGAEKFTLAEYENETKAQWYLRQMLGSANFHAGPVMGLMSGGLCYQIEHHVFPDLPSNRYPHISKRMRALCEKYDLPYTTGPLAKQFFLSMRTIHKLSFPDRFLRRTSDDAPETSSERKFVGAGG